MSRSFQIVEDKIFEADFFLEKLQETTLTFKIHEAQFYLSAFLSASRSITFCIQASISDLPDFENWYSKQQSILKANKTAQYFVFARNHSQKVGYYPIGGGYTYKENDVSKMDYQFDIFYPDDKTIIPEFGVLTSCRIYFTLILEIVYDCYKKFGPSIDPNQYYTIENISNLGLTIEDIEESMGFPRGYTNIPGSTINEGLNVFKSQEKSECADVVLKKYLNKGRLE